MIQSWFSPTFSSIFPPFLVDFSEKNGRWPIIWRSWPRCTAWIRSSGGHSSTFARRPWWRSPEFRMGFRIFGIFHGYIYIWSPWDKNMDISMENVGTGYFMDISRNNLGFPRKFPWTFQAKKWDLHGKGDWWGFKQAQVRNGEIVVYKLNTVIRFSVARVTYRNISYCNTHVYSYIIKLRGFTKRWEDRAK